MKLLQIPIREKLFHELIDAAAECYQPDETPRLTPEQFALEAIETTLAQRRLERIGAL